MRLYDTKTNQKIAEEICAQLRQIEDAKAADGGREVTNGDKSGES